MQRTLTAIMAAAAFGVLAMPAQAQNYAEQYNQANRLPVHTAPHLNGSTDSYPGTPRRYVFRQGRLTPIAGIDELFPHRTGVRTSRNLAGTGAYAVGRTSFNRTPSFASNDILTAPGGYTVTRFR